MTTEGDELRFLLRLPRHPLSVAIARHAVQGLKPWLSGDRADRLELITSEAVTNALRHASAKDTDVIEYELLASPSQVQVRVGDNGPEFQIPPRPSSPDQIGGYGLMIIAELAASWEINRTSTGNNLLFTI